MIREQRLAVSLLAAGLITLGVLTVIYRDFAYTWQPVPQFHPGREALAVVCGLFMIAVSVALLFRSTAAIAVRALFPFLIVWECLKLPGLISAPGSEGSWLSLGETGMLLAGGWTLFACLSQLDDVAFFRPMTGERGAHLARTLFALSLLPVGASHIVYIDVTTLLVPSWLPFRSGFGYLTGMGQMACGLGILFWVLPRVAAWAEVAMLTLFAFLVWGPNTWFSTTPKLPGSPAGLRFDLTAFLITWIILAAAVAVAAEIDAGRKPWRSAAGVDGSDFLVRQRRGA